MEKKTALFIFGATGDLAKRKIFPGIKLLCKKNPEFLNVDIIGISRKQFGKTEFLSFLKTEIFNSEDISPLEKNTDFISGDFNNDELYSKIEEYILKNGIQKAFIHLSVPPTGYNDIIVKINRLALTSVELFFLSEKPFGNSPAEANKIATSIQANNLSSNFYIIDHYLYKKIVESFLKFRFEISLFESALNKNYVKSIEIKINETSGIEKRSIFYDSTGALTDVGQNHALEMLALVTMDKFDKYNPVSFAEKREWAIKSFEVIDQSLILGQYSSYKTIEGLERSCTETFFKMELKLKSPRWRGVVAKIEGGKKLSKVEKEIKINFKNGDFLLISFNRNSEYIIANINNKEISYFSEKENEEGESYLTEYCKAFNEIILKSDFSKLVTVSEAKFCWNLILPVFNKLKDPNRIVTYNDYSYPLLHKNVENHKKTVGIIGLGKMGGGIAYQLLDKGWNLFVYNRTPEKMADFVKNKANGFNSVKDLCSAMSKPRTILLYLPEGDPVEEVIFSENGLINFLETGDIIIDGGNSNYIDSLRRFKLLEGKGIEFIDMGTSGGPTGARNGATVMVGGKPDVTRSVEYLFESICETGGYTIFSNPGEGHFVKMVHNGIEYGMIESIAEGFELINTYSPEIDLLEVAGNYSSGSIIESKLIVWLWQAFLIYSNKLDTISHITPHTGMGDWTVETGKNLGVDVKVIEDSLNFRITAKSNPRFAGKIVTAIRHMFGRHDKD